MKSITPRAAMTSRRAALLGIAALPFSRAALAAADTTAADQPEQRILIVGDSQAQGLAGAFMRHYRRDKNVRVIDRSKISTGLMHRPNYDWVAQIKGIAAADKADVAIVLFGANDRPQVRAGEDVNGPRLSSFRQRYAEAVTAIVKPLMDAHMPVIWVGHPVVRDADFSRDMALLDTIYEQAATQAGAVYVSTWDLFSHNGAYDAFGPGPDGQQTRLRADDGAHLTPAGYDVLANYLLPSIDTAEARAKSGGGSASAAAQSPAPAPAKTN